MDGLCGYVAGLTEGESLNFDMKAVDAVDGGALALLVNVRSDLMLRGVECEFLNTSPRVRELVHLYRGDADTKPHPKKRPEGVLDQIGRTTIAFLAETKQVLGFLGTCVLAALGLLREPRTANWKAIPSIMVRAGTDAVPIVVLINFLVGFVMGFQGAVQLKQFGANIFVADLVGLSVTRELGPLMTAIIVCGRSGAAFAAELGTMKVSEEIDALRTLGFGPVRYLVLPRAIGLMLVMPFLTLFADLVGVLGGLRRTREPRPDRSRATSSRPKRRSRSGTSAPDCSRASCSRWPIAVISCQRGFATTGGAEGVGRRTTASVVSILFSLILIDASIHRPLPRVQPMSDSLHTAACEVLIDVVKLTIGWEADAVLQRDAYFQVERGDVFVILGGSGCGKSTLFATLLAG